MGGKETRGGRGLSVTELAKVRPKEKDRVVERTSGLGSPTRCPLHSQEVGTSWFKAVHVPEEKGVVVVGPKYILKSHASPCHPASQTQTPPNPQVPCPEQLPKQAPGYRTAKDIL